MGNCPALGMVDIGDTVIEGRDLFRVSAEGTSWASWDGRESHGRLDGKREPVQT